MIEALTRFFCAVILRMNDQEDPSLSIPKRDENFPREKSDWIR
jgi:hypothetical protein